MKIVSFEQTSQSWLEWRMNGIGASDIGVIMGVDPYKKPKRLWKEKCGFVGQPKSNFAMAHGRKNEGIALKKFNSIYGYASKPVCVEHSEKPHWRASLDGWDAENGVIVEVKCPVSAEKISEIKSTRHLPDNWYYQIQWQIAVCFLSYKNAFFAMWDYRDEELISWEITFNEKEFSSILNKVEEFWDSVRRGKCPY